jgi:hypothetical protein
VQVGGHLSAQGLLRLELTEHRLGHVDGVHVPDVRGEPSGDQARARAEVEDLEGGRQRHPGAEGAQHPFGDLRGDGPGVPVGGLVVEQVAHRPSRSAS